MENTNEQAVEYQAPSYGAGTDAETPQVDSAQASSPSAVQRILQQIGVKPEEQPATPVEPDVDQELAAALAAAEAAPKVAPEPQEAEAPESVEPVESVETETVATEPEVETEVEAEIELKEEPKQAPAEPYNGCESCQNTGFAGGKVGATSSICAECDGSPFGVKE